MLLLEFCSFNENQSLSGRVKEIRKHCTFIFTNEHGRRLPNGSFDGAIGQCVTDSVSHVSLRTSFEIIYFKSPF